MKKKLLLAGLLMSLINLGYSQSSVTVSGGWATAAADDTDNSLDGFKISGQYEYPMGYNNWAVGGSLTYLGFKDAGSRSVTTKYHSWPISFYGKYLIGKKKLQGYIKGVAGAQFTGIKIENQNGSIKDTDFGFDFGAGAGANYTVSEKVFLNLDYEFLYLINSAYNNGIINAVTLGVGFRI